MNLEKQQFRIGKREKGCMLLTYIFSEKFELIINIKKQKIRSVSKFRELTVDSKEAIAVILIPWPQQLFIYLFN